MFLKKSKYTFSVCYLILIVLTVLGMQLQLYSVNKVGDRDFIIDSESNHAV